MAPGWFTAGMAGSSGGQRGEIIIRSVPRASVARIDLGETRIAYCAHATRFFHRMAQPLASERHHTGDGPRARAIMGDHAT
jgi:hypothetical protein